MEARTGPAVVGVHHSVIVEGRPDDPISRMVEGSVLRLTDPSCAFVARGVELQRVRAKAYWVPGKIGLDRRMPGESQSEGSDRAVTASIRTEASHLSRRAPRFKWSMLDGLSSSSGTSLS